MKKLIIISLFFLAFNSANAQEKISYSSKVGKIEFEISTNEVYVEYSSQDAKTIEPLTKGKLTKLSSTSSIIQTDNLTGKFDERKSQFKKQFHVTPTRIEPVLIYKDGIKQIVAGKLNIKIKPGYNITSIIKDYDFEINQSQFTPSLFTLTSNSITTQQLFQIIDRLQTDKRVEFAEPNFIRELKPFTNDQFFASQWSIKNQGYLGGTVGADMHVEQAWNNATGMNIKVAIIDEGVDLNHLDLQANLLSGYDATGNGSNGASNQSTNDAHGTACAGIVAAVANNNIGIAGIAYNSKIIPVRIAYSNGYPLGNPLRAWITNDSWIANGINWAWQHGADVLSNSWGGGSYSNTIKNAIDDAINNGRGGKGCVVLFATGNNNGAVSFPATLENVIAVGASSTCDERKSFTSCDGEAWGSNYGSELDVVAPGVQIYTTDISGSAGYNSTDYRSDFNGTSSATPNAAGVVALILSVNSNLTGSEVRNILETSVDKVLPNTYNYQTVGGHPNGIWNEQVGYGRINAANAVCMTMNQTLTISGLGYICTSETYSINTNLPVTWSISPAGMVNLNPSGNQVILTRVYDGPFTLTATINNGCGVPISRQLLSGTTFTPSTYIIGGVPDNFTFCIGSSFNVYSTISPVPVSNNWSVIGGTITLGQGTPHINIQLDNTPGGYAIMVPYTDACGGTRIAELQGTKVDDGCQGSNTQTEAQLQKIIIFPNPTSNYITIGIPNNFLGGSLRLRNIHGQVVRKEIITNTLTKIDVQTLTNGVYLTEITSKSGKTEKRKIIVAH
jgi:subtilisin family serine protease